MHLVRIAAGLAVLLAGSAQAAGTGQGNDPNRRICKSKPVIGSRLQRVRECHSAAEWEDIELAERISLQTRQFNGDPSQSVSELSMPARMEAPN